MLVSDSYGKLSFQAGEHAVGLDAASQNTFVSHAHLDHVPSYLHKSRRVLCSEATRDLISSRIALGDAVCHHHPFSLDGFRLSMPESGHILGSRQLLIEGDGSRFVYTGDLRTSDSLLFKGAQPVECDTLLVESTYGLPRFRFPPREEVYGEISRWVKNELEGGCVVLGGYPVGKAQELVKTLNEYLGITPLVSSGIAKVCEAYVKHGLKLDFIPSDSAGESGAVNGSFVAVLPHNKVNSSLASGLSRQYGKKISTALATGWASNRSWGFDVDRVFCLSDHCDFYQLMDFALATGARRIFTNHGYSREFASELAKLGKSAVAVEDIRPARGQQTLVAKGRA
jgi:putative mRNA 3-end processing factor